MPNEQGGQFICPFMSAKDAPVFCQPSCKLYRAKNTNFECYFMELQAISWNSKGGGQSRYAPPPPHF